MTSERVLKALADAARHAAGEEPDAAMLASAPLLEGWMMTAIGESEFIIEGVVSGHPRVPDGLISTTRIVALAHDDSWCRTIGRYYRLGRPLFSRGHA